MLLTHDLCTSKFKRTEDLKDEEGSTTTIYVDKSKSLLDKDKIAVAFITDNALVVADKYTSTIIKAKTSDDKVQYFKSNKALSFEGLISLVFKLKIDGYFVDDLVNLSETDNFSICKVEKIASESNLIKVTIDDSRIGNIDTIINNKSNLINRLYSAKLVIVQGELRDNNLLDIVTMGICKIQQIINTTRIDSSEGLVYGVVESNDIVCVIENNSILITFIKESEVVESIINSIHNTIKKELKGVILNNVVYIHRI